MLAVRKDVLQFALHVVAAPCLTCRKERSHLTFRAWLEVPGTCSEMFSSQARRIGGRNDADIGIELHGCIPQVTQP